MHTRRFIVKVALSGMVTQIGFLPLRPVCAQDAPPQKQARVVIRTPDGEQVIDLDPNDLADLGGNQLFAVQVGPDGKITTSLGSQGVFIGPGAIRMAGPNGMVGMKGLTIIDPGKNYALPLLKREDVQAQLFLSPRQREALDALEKNQQAELQQQIKLSALPSPGDIAGKSKEELRAVFTERAVKMREEVQALNSERDKKMAEILTPAQWARLKELDLQWRGPLAMGVKEVAEQAKLTPPQTTGVADLLKTYRQEVNKRMGMGFKTVSLAQKPGTGTPLPRSETPPPTTPAEMQANLEKTAREIETARKSLGDKALTTISSEQKAQWAALTGKPFVFRN